jgi:hypothetical protein
MNLFVNPIKHTPVIKNVEPIIYLMLSVFRESKAVVTNACTHTQCNINIYWYKNNSLYCYSGIKVCL